MRAYDPEGMTEAEPLLKDVEWCTDSYYLVGGGRRGLITEWNNSVARPQARQVLMKQPIMVDLRNI